MKMRFRRSKNGFHVTDFRSACWLVRRIVEARDYRRRVEEWAALELRRAEREESFFLARWGRELEDWTRQQIAQQHRRKSVALPAGTVGFRLEPPRFDYLDEVKLMVWCQRHVPRAIKTTQSVLKSVLKEHVEQTGELPDGVAMSGGGEKFFIR